MYLLKYKVSLRIDQIVITCITQFKCTFNTTTEWNYIEMVWHILFTLIVGNALSQSTCVHTLHTVLNESSPALVFPPRSPHFLQRTPPPEWWASLWAPGGAGPPWLALAGPAARTPGPADPGPAGPAPAAGPPWAATARARPGAAGGRSWPGLERRWPAAHGGLQSTQARRRDETNTNHGPLILQATINAKQIHT